MLEKEAISHKQETFRPVAAWEWDGVSVEVSPTTDQKEDVLKVVFASKRYFGRPLKLEEVTLCGDHAIMRYSNREGKYS